MTDTAPKGLDALIAALTIFRKYANPPYPTGCDHDVMYVYVDPSVVSAEDLAALDAFGFEADADIDGFRSYRFGSA